MNDQLQEVKSLLGRLNLTTIRDTLDDQLAPAVQENLSCLAVINHFI